MKKIILAAFAFFITLAATAQNPFPGKHPELLLNKEVKILPLESLQKSGYREFHKNEEFKATDNPIKYDKLVGKSFKVVSVTPYVHYGRERFKIKLESAENGTYYYNYNPAYDFEYQLEVVGSLVLPEGIYCSDIEVVKDKFTGEIRKTTPYKEGISLIKTVKDGKTTIYFAINERGSTANVGKKGLTLLLANGKKIEKPNANIDVKVNDARGASGYIYSAFEMLTAADIALLLESPITDNRLYIYDGTIKDGSIIIEYLKCLTKD